MTEKTANNSFKFFANFLYAIDKLPEEKRAKACYEFCRFGITGELPKDENLSMFCVGVSASVQKYQGRGGNHNPSGKNQWSNEVKSGQNGQNGLNEQTETETETEIKEINKESDASHDATDSQIKLFIDRWNKGIVSYGVPKIMEFSEARRSKLKKRFLQAKRYFPDLDYSDAVFKIISDSFLNSSFLRGETKSGFKFGIDFVLQESSFIKMYEGYYNDKE